MSIKVVTGPNTRFSYVTVWEPKSNNGSEPKYSASLLIPKTDIDTIQKINAAIQAAYESGADILKGKSSSVPALAAIRTPLRDGDVERPDDPGYAGCYFIHANNKRQPGVVDAQCNPILDKTEVYSGCYGRASINLYAYNSNGNRGIGAALNHIQKLRDGEPLGGGSTAAQDFGGLESAPAAGGINPITGLPM